jgi:hypothetical protein
VMRGIWEPGMKEESQSNRKSQEKSTMS